MASSGMLRHVALVRTDVSSIIMRYVPLKRRFLQEPHGVTSQKTPLFIVTAVETSNPTRDCSLEHRSGPKPVWLLPTINCAVAAMKGLSYKSSVSLVVCLTN
jgi:hypothetical protein